MSESSRAKILTSPQINGIGETPRAVLESFTSRQALRSQEKELGVSAMLVDSQRSGRCKTMRYVLPFTFAGQVLTWNAGS